MRATSFAWACVSRAIGIRGRGVHHVGVAAMVSLVRAAIVAALFVAAVARGHSLLWFGPGVLAVAAVTAGRSVVCEHPARRPAAWLISSTWFAA